MNLALAALPEAARSKLRQTPMPEHVAPMLATLAQETFSSADWVYERKLDGKVTSFERLQKRLGVTDPEEARARGVDVDLYLFDILYLDGYDTSQLGLTEWTKSGKLRHPRFLGLRHDKSASEVHRE